MLKKLVIVVINYLFKKLGTKLDFLIIIQYHQYFEIFIFLFFNITKNTSKLNLYSLYIYLPS